MPAQLTFLKDLDTVCQIVEGESYSVPLENLRWHNNDLRLHDMSSLEGDAAFLHFPRIKGYGYQSGHCQPVQAVQLRWTDASGAADFHSYPTEYPQFHPVLCTYAVGGSAREACLRLLVRDHFGTSDAPGIIDKTSFELLGRSRDSCQHRVWAVFNMEMTAWSLCTADQHGATLWRCFFWAQDAAGGFRIGSCSRTVLVCRGQINRRRAAPRCCGPSHSKPTGKTDRQATAH